MLRKEIYTPIFNIIEEKLAADEQFTIAIDGPCGTGKTILSEIIKKKYDCNIFHMDDFFLPIEMKTKERLAEPGGNVYYERFLDEVLKPLETGETIHYQPFNCQIMQLEKPEKVQPKKLNIVEGVYSLHPTLQRFYDWKVFLTVKPDIQLNRIAERNGEVKLRMFMEKWIPLENHYFSDLKIEALCDTVIDTSNI